MLDIHQPKQDLRVIGLCLLTGIYRGNKVARSKTRKMIEERPRKIQKDEGKGRGKAAKIKDKGILTDENIKEKT